MIRDINAFIEESVSILGSKRKELETEKQKINEFLKEKLIPKLSTEKIIIQDRVKGSDSLREKVIRKSYFEKHNGNASNFIADLPDIIGIRLVCLLNDDELLLDNDLKRIFSLDSEEFSGYKCMEVNGDSNLYIQFKDKPDIQKNNNPIYKYSCLWVREGKSYNLEIQIKSLIHMFWGELEHMLIYKNYNYLVDSQFYGKIMDSTYNLLRNVDNQLKVIQSHLQTSDTSRQIKEVKEMLAKILHKNLQEKIERCLDCKIDLRMLYDSIIHILFYDTVDTNAIFERANQYLSRAAQFSISDEQLDLTGNSLVSARVHGLGDGIKELCIFLDSVFKSNDIYWQLFYRVYSHLEAVSDYSNVLISMANKIIESYRRSYIEDITIEEEALKYFNRAIILSLISSFKYYKKVDFIVNQDGIVKIISDFIQTYQETIEELASNERNDEILNYIGSLLSSQIIVSINNKIDPTYLKPITDNLMNEEIKWQPLIIEKEMLEGFVQGKNLSAEILLKILQGEKLGGE
ncbi:hypothetical protein M3589_17985 [Heyndrickxia oleronia]|uniref:hypothetical protein n=1 Tax=Heyndrickxia oleronia TaxID=38875 RepID=UPI00203CB9E3|nr:hypothetical protein [Heyndrickxia oleronia]MCM3239593.1 hypothetical protein [Heyndrickxia oleronia]